MSPLSLALSILAAASALALTAWLYLTPLSGVSGTPAPLLTGFGAAATALAVLVVAVADPGGLRGLFAGLAVLGALCTLLAGYFIASWAIVALMAAALLLLVVGLATRARPAPRSGTRGVTA